jgi:hypothetical protein
LSKFLPDFIAKPHESAGLHSAKLPFFSDRLLCEVGVLSPHRFHVIEFGRWVEKTTIHLIYRENG